MNYLPNDYEDGYTIGYTIGELKGFKYGYLLGSGTVSFVWFCFEYIL